MIRSRITKELTDRAASLVPLLERNAALTERERRVAEENILALQSADVFRLAVPKRYGGLEMDVRTMLEVSSTLAEGCGATGWVASLCSQGAWVASLFPKAAQDEVFGADPNARVVGALAPTARMRPVSGGYVVSGKWPWCSGSLHSSWAVLGAPITDDQGNVVDDGIVLLPKSDWNIEDTWFVTGMRGTGSNTIVAEEAFVPSHRLLSVSGAIQGHYGTPFKDEALYRSPFVPVIVLMLVGPLLGLGRAALRFVRGEAPNRGIAYTHFTRQTDSAAFQIALAESATKIDAAHLLAYRSAGDIDAAAAANEPLPMLTRGRVRADSGFVAESIPRAIDRLMSAHGASSFAESSPLQRIWRDASAGARHAALNSDVASEVYGKLLLGVESKITELV